MDGPDYKKDIGAFVRDFINDGEELNWHQKYILEDLEKGRGVNITIGIIPFKSHITVKHILENPYFIVDDPNPEPDKKQVKNFKQSIIKKSNRHGN